MSVKAESKYVGEIDTCSQFYQNFTTSFCWPRSQKSKKDWWLDCIFVLLGSTRVKAAKKMLVKLTPVVNITNITNEQLLLQYSLAKKILSQTVIREKLCKALL